MENMPAEYGYMAGTIQQLVTAETIISRRGGVKVLISSFR